ncbi:MAG: translation initiation factor IF-2, partial [Selenomonadales bacterium]|nr:translation initiation factor IF-2 [Selenomonadales bacterium]
NAQQGAGQQNRAPQNSGNQNNRFNNNRPNAQGMNRGGQMNSNNRFDNNNRFGNNNNRPNNNQGGKNNFRNNKNNNKKQRNQKDSVMHQQAAQAMLEASRPKAIKVGGPMTVKELAARMGREVSELIKKLMLMGTMATINQELDIDAITLVAGEFGVAVQELPPEEDPTEVPEIEDDPANLVGRPPVVTVMGHVDHGKTSLLDAIRKTHVTSQEAGGITQHIGAYQVMCNGQKIVFLDTPGHEAFTSMRARGAKITDIAILVVAADDGVMPQTIEAINHAKSAQVPIIVAINKIDRPGANPDRIMQQLSENGLIPEDWGGDTIVVQVSAHQKIGITDLLEMILLVAEMQELKADPKRPAQGTIIEAKLDKGRGTVATVLVQTGTLSIGDSIIAGTAYGKVRAMMNDRGEKVKKAGPSTPVEVLGLSDVPAAGDILNAVEEKIAKSVAEKRLAKRRSEEMSSSQKVSLDDLFKQIQAGTIKDLNILIKADVQGSLEAVRQSLLKLNETNNEVRVNVVHAGVGAVNESDIMLASASNALIIGFNIRPDANARRLADSEQIDIRLYRVIYEAISDVEAAMKGLLAPQYKEVQLGRAEIRQVMSFSKALVAGCYVLEGKLTNSAQLRIVRNGVVVHDGMIESLRRFKDDVKEVASGYECGVTIEKFRDIKENDIIEAYTMEQIKPES